MLITYMWNLKYDTSALIYETETDSQTWKVDLQWPRGRRDGGWELGISICKLLYIGWINSEVLLYSTGSYTHYPVINIKEKNMKKNV